MPSLENIPTRDPSPEPEAPLKQAQREFANLVKEHQGSVPDEVKAGFLAAKSTLLPTAEFEHLKEFMGAAARYYQGTTLLRQLRS